MRSSTVSPYFLTWKLKQSKLGLAVYILIVSEWLPFVKSISLNNAVCQFHQSLGFLCPRVGLSETNVVSSTLKITESFKLISS